MKRFWLVLLSLGMVLAFSASAMAVDVKFSGDFTIGGMYLNKTSLQKTDSQGMEWHYKGHHMSEATIPAAYATFGVPNTGVPLHTPNGSPIYVKHSPVHGTKTGGALTAFGTIPLGQGEKVKNNSDDGPSTAFFWQRLRLRTDFVVAPGLSFVTRADIMSRVWGGKRSENMDNEDLQGSSILHRPNSTYESENIIFDWAYISYTSPIGLFMVGYQNDNAWGTVFGDSATPAPAIQYVLPVGQAVLIAKYSKGDDNSIHRGSQATERNPVTGAITKNARYQHTDYDQDQYVLAGIYNFKAGSVGLLAKYIRMADVYPTMPNADFDWNREDFGKQDGIMLKAWVLAPYAKFKIGPVAIQTEVNWINGKVQKVTNTRWNRYAHGDYKGGAHDIDIARDPAVGTHGPGGALGDQDRDREINAVSAWVDAVVDLDKFYIGGTLAYISGDDRDTADKIEGIFVNGGNDWNPCLIMWNFDRTYWAGSIYGNNGSGQNGPMGGSQYAENNPGANFVQARVGVRPTPAWDIMASLSYAVASERPASGVFVINEDGHPGKAGFAVTQAPWLHTEYGYEVDLTATYKITNNLSYMLGAGYMFTGDYYKGISDENQVQDNYMVINKLTLTF